MLCTLAIRHFDPWDSDGSRYCLRLTGKTALGPSGTGGRDEMRFAEVDLLMTKLDELRVPAEIIERAAAVIHAHDRKVSFVTIGTDVQIPFDLLEGSGFYLFDL